MITLGVRSWIADMLCFVRGAHVTASGDAVCREADPQVQLEPADPAGGSGRNSVWKETSPEQGPGGRAESAPARDQVLTPGGGPAGSPGLLGVRQGQAYEGAPGTGRGTGKSRPQAVRTRPL